MKKSNLAIVIACVMMFIGCQHQTEVVKIGAILPMTGNMSGQGISVKAGLDLAIEELNSQSSHTKYELYIEDVASEQRNVIAAYNKLKEINDVNIFVTKGSAYSLALKPAAIKDNKLLFCIASHPDITANGEYNIFKVGNSSVDEGNAIMDYLGKSDARTIMFYPNTEYGIPFREVCQNRNNNIVCIEYDESMIEYKNIVISAIKAAPDNIIAIGFSSALGRLIKTLRDMGYNGMIVSNTGFQSLDVLSAAGEARKGVVYVDYNIEESEETMRRDKFVREKYHINFSSICYLAYAIPYFLNSVDEELYFKNTRQISDEIRTKQFIQLSSNYTFSIFQNGDIKPDLLMKKEE